MAADLAWVVLGLGPVVLGGVVLTSWLRSRRREPEELHIGSLPVRRSGTIDWTGGVQEAERKSRSTVDKATAGRGIETADLVWEVRHRRDPSRQETALRELINRRAGAECLPDAFRATDPSVLQAAFALAMAHGASCERAVADALPALPDDLASEAIAWLASTGGRDAREALVRALADRRLVRQALEALAECGTVAELPAIEPLTPSALGNVDDLARRARSAILARTNPEDVGKLTLTEACAAGALSLDATGGVTVVPDKVPEG